MIRLLGGLFLVLSSTFSYSSPIQWSANGHYYELIETLPDLLSWEESVTQTDTLSWLGLDAHLVVITSQEENDFIQSIMPVDAYTYWTGGFQSDTSGAVDEGWEWITGEQWLYTNWGVGEPNDDLGRQQDAMVFTAHLGGIWADGDRPANGSTLGYIVEYEASTVPIPTAAWLFGSALLGLGAMKRRTNSRSALSC